MSETVERLARAYDEVLSRWGVRLIDPKLRDEMCRAAILTMREPTEGMCTTGQKANNLSDEPGAFEFLSRDEMTAAWQAMCDEALK